MAKEYYLFLTESSELLAVKTHLSSLLNAYFSFFINTYLKYLVVESWVDQLFVHSDPLQIG